jgi:MOSC domain-containing protein YiiM
MPALIPTQFQARVVWLGRVADREAALRSRPLEEVAVRFEGFEGEAHGGLTRPSCSRVTALHPKGTPIRNARQIAVASVEELAAIAAAMGLDGLEPAWIGASLVLEGLPDLSHLPPSSRLQGPDGATLVVDMENRPCHLPAAPIDEDAPGFGRLFKAAAAGRRGITASVEREGRLRLGDALRLFVPDQRAWTHLDEARGLRTREPAAV